MPGRRFKPERIGENGANRWTVRRGGTPGDLLLPPWPTHDDGEDVTTWDVEIVIDVPGNSQASEYEQEEIVGADLRFAGVVKTFRVIPRTDGRGSYARCVVDVTTLIAFNESHRVAEDPGYHGADPARWPDWVR